MQPQQGEDINQEDSVVVDKTQAFKDLVEGRAHDNWLASQHSKRKFGYPSDTRPDRPIPSAYEGIVPFKVITQIRDSKGNFSKEDFKQALHLAYDPTLFPYDRDQVDAVVDGLDDAQFSEWMDKLVNVWTKKNENWSRVALFVLKQLDITLEELPNLDPRSEKVATLIGLEEVFEGIDHSKSAYEILHVLAEDPMHQLLETVLIATHDGWRDDAIRSNNEVVDYPMGDVPRDILKEIAESEGVCEKFAMSFEQLIDDTIHSEEAIDGKGWKDKLRGLIESQRAEAHQDRNVVSAETYELLLSIALDLETEIDRLTSDTEEYADLDHDKKAAMLQGLKDNYGDVMWIIKMDANPAILNVILDQVGQQDEIEDEEAAE